MDFHCVQYQAETETRDLVGVTMKSGRAAAQGICVDCGAKKFRIDVPPPATPDSAGAPRRR